MQKKNSVKEKPNKIPKRDADAFLEISGIRLPVWITVDEFVVVATLSNGMEIVFNAHGNFKHKQSKVLATDEIMKSMNELKIEGLTFAELQKKNYYE